MTCCCFSCGCRGTGERRRSSSEGLSGRKRKNSEGKREILQNFKAKRTYCAVVEAHNARLAVGVDDKDASDHGGTQQKSKGLPPCAKLRKEFQKKANTEQ